MIKLGDKVNDKLTDFSGTVVCQTEYLNGCTRFGVQPRKLEGGKPVDWEYFDENQLEVIAEPVADIDTEIPGGPCPNPPKL